MWSSSTIYLAVRTETRYCSRRAIHLASSGPAGPGARRRGRGRRIAAAARAARFLEVLAVPELACMVPRLVESSLELGPPPPLHVGAENEAGPPSRAARTRGQLAAWQRGRLIASSHAKIGSGRSANCAPGTRGGSGGRAAAAAAAAAATASAARQLGVAARRCSGCLGRAPRPQQHRPASSIH